MQNMRKYALKESLKRLMLKKSLDRITINDLTSDCGISRITFYYHLEIFMIWQSGPVWRNPEKLFRVKKLTIPGRKDLYRFLRLFTKIRLLCRMPVMSLEEKKLELSF